MTSHLKNFVINQKDMDPAVLKPNSLKGISNGQFGFGFSGGMFPKFMNGPFGSYDRPIPNTQEKLVLYDSPIYNSKLGNFPAYNEDAFIARSRFAYTPVYGTTFGPNGLSGVPTQAPFIRQ
jgi:hypothetical protein